MIFGFLLFSTVRFSLIVFLASPAYGMKFPGNFKLLVSAHRPPCHVSSIHPATTPVTCLTFFFAVVFSTLPDYAALIIPIYVDTSLVVLGAIRSRMQKNAAANPPNARTEVRDVKLTTDNMPLNRSKSLLVQRSGAVEKFFICTPSTAREAFLSARRVILQRDRNAWNGTACSFGFVGVELSQDKPGLNDVD